MHQNGGLAGAAPGVFVVFQGVGAVASVVGVFGVEEGAPFVGFGGSKEGFGGGGIDQVGAEVDEEKAIVFWVGSEEAEEEGVVI